jgi:hypothetical protein
MSNIRNFNFKPKEKQKYMWETVELEEGEEPYNLTDFFTEDEVVVFKQVEGNFGELGTIANIAFDYTEIMIWLQSQDKRTILRIPLETAFHYFRPLYNQFKKLRPVNTKLLL